MAKPDAGARPQPEDRRALALVVLAVVLAALLPRLVGIDFGLPAIIHEDELEPVGRAQQLLELGSFTEPQAWRYPPLLAELLAVDRGLRPCEGCEHAVFLLRGRWLSAIVSALGAGLLVLAGRRVGLRLWAAALAGLVLAWSPLLVRLGRYATPDALMTALVAFGVWAAAGVVRHGRWRDYLLGGLAVGLAAGAKYNAALIFVMILAAHLLSRPKQLGAWGRLLAAGGVSLVSFAGILAWPWAGLETFLSGLRYEWRHYGKGHDGFDCANAAKEALAYLFGFALGPLAGVALGLGSIAALFGLRGRKGQAETGEGSPDAAPKGPARARRDLGYAALAFVLVYLLLLTRQNLFFARLVAPLIPALAVLIALAASVLVELVVDRFGARWRPLATTSTLGLILLLPAVATVRQLQAIRAPDTRRLAYEWIDANLREPETRLVVIPRSARRLVPPGIESTTVYSGMSVRRMGEIGATHVVFNAGSIERFRWRPEQNREALATWEALHEQLKARARLVRRWQHAPLPGARHFGDSARTIHHSAVELWALDE